MSRAATVVPYCGFCGQGHHALCSGGCVCATQAHAPDDALAARMRIYQRPDLDGDTVANLAAEYRGGDR